MKILYIVTSLQIGGAERIVLNLANNFSKNHDVTVVTLMKNCPLRKYLHETVRIVHYDFTGWISILRFNVLLQLRGEIETADVIHCHMFHPSILASLVSKKKQILTYHTSTFSQFRKFLFYIFRNSRLSDIAIYPSNCGWWSSRNVALIPNAVPSSFVKNHRLQIKKTSLKLCFCGSLNWNKGILALINDLAESRISYNLELHVVGGGELYSEVMNLKTQYESRLKVFVYGQLEDVTDVYENCDVLVIYSKREGLPMVALEAAMNGLAVISTPCGGMPWLMSDNRGYICER
jgi:glycosyltransferase involved in cell wall biosynthesis